MTPPKYTVPDSIKQTRAQQGSRSPGKMGFEHLCQAPIAYIHNALEGKREGCMKTVTNDTHMGHWMQCFGKMENSKSIILQNDRSSGKKLSENVPCTLYQ